MNIDLGMLIPWFPALATVLCGVCCFKPAWRKFAGAICVISIFISFLITVGVYFTPQLVGDGSAVVHAFDWIHAGSLQVSFAYYFDHREEIESYFEESEQAAAELEAARDAYLKQRPGM